MDRGAWWAAVHGVAQSQTRLKWLNMHACIGEGNGNPPQYSCLENPRDRQAWWAVVYGVTQSRIGLKRLSSSSSRDSTCKYLINILFIYYTSLYALIMQNKYLGAACCRKKNLQGLELAKNIHERTGNEWEESGKSLIWRCNRIIDVWHPFYFSVKFVYFHHGLSW